VRRIIAAAGQLDSLTLVALACLVFGWFFTDTLVTSWGSLRHGVRFFHLSVILRDPSMMFFQIPLSLRVLRFALLCMACIAAPLLPRQYARRWLAVANFAPLLLLLVCAWLLHQRTAGDFLPAAQMPDGVAGRAVGLANRLLNRGSAVVSHHIAVGLGGYLGGLACVALAAQGVWQLMVNARDAPSARGRSAAVASRRLP
jgi:hypothetical protein